MTDTMRALVDEMRGAARSSRKHGRDDDADTFEKAAAYLARSEALLAGREGWKLVPVEPTPEMYGAGGVVQFKCDLAMTPVRRAVGNVYRAMLAAAPPPPTVTGKGEGE